MMNSIAGKKYAIFIFFVIPSMFMSLANAFSHPVNVDAYQTCLTRTKHVRLSGQSGCGMIIQQCYDEGVADLDEKTNSLKLELEKNGVPCTSLADNYLIEATRMEDIVEKSAANLVGWVRSELALSFARQRLINMEIIKNSCKQ